MHHRLSIITDLFTEKIGTSVNVFGLFIRKVKVDLNLRP